MQILLRSGGRLTLIYPQVFVSSRDIDAGCHDVFLGQWRSIPSCATGAGALRHESGAEIFASRCSRCRGGLGPAPSRNIAEVEGDVSP